MPLLRLGPVSVPSPDEVVDATRSALGWGGEVVALGASLPARIDALVVEVERLVGVLGRIADRADGLIDRADTLVAACDTVIDTAKAITAGASEVVESSRGITTGANEVVELSRGITTGANEVVELSRGITTGANEVVELSRGITTGANEVVELSRKLTTGASEVMDQAGTTSTAAQELLALYRPMLERGAPLAGRFVDELSPEEVESAIKLVDQLPVLTEHMVSDIMPILETFDRVAPDLHELLDVTKDLRQGIAGIPGLSFFVKRGADKDE